MLDAVEDEGGPVMADRVLSYVRKAFNWRAARDDDFVPPIVPGMARTKGKDRARDRILSDEEIRELWQVLDQGEVASCHARFIRVLLLTGQRRSEVARADWREISADTWTIPAARYKTKIDHVVPLTAAVLAVLGEPQGHDRRASGFVFSNDGGRTALASFGRAKAELDRAIDESRRTRGLEPMPRWTLHDLRRTARSLMSRAGVAADVAERVLGHVIAGVRSVYDRHGYEAEKREALERLAALVERIVHPGATVVRLRG